MNSYLHDQVAKARVQELAREAVVFAAYALGALAGLLLAGRLSDNLGRRPLLAAGLPVLLGAMLLFAFARSVEWLLAARLVQGAATGTILSAAGAVALLPEPVVRAARPSLRPQRPVVPAEVRGAFALASAGVVASWSIAGLYLPLAAGMAGAVASIHADSGSSSVR